MKCDVSSCKNNDVFADVEWKSITHCKTTVTLCKDCTDRLWSVLSPMINANMATAKIDKPGTLKATNVTTGTK